MSVWFYLETGRLRFLSSIGVCCQVDVGLSLRVKCACDVRNCIDCCDYRNCQLWQFFVVSFYFSWGRLLVIVFNGGAK